MIRRIIHISFLPLVLAIVFPASIYAFDLHQKVQIHGFLSLGYLSSSGNDFLADSKGGTFDFNEIGINVNSQLSHSFRIGAQIISRDLGDYGDNKPRLDWALIDYHAHDAIGTRLGKIKIPMGFYNTERDSDFLRPMIFLPQSIYDETRRDLWLSHTGGEAYGNLSSENLGDLDYQIFYGRIDYEKDTVYYDSSLQNIQNRLRTVSDPNNLLPDYISDFERDNKYLYGGALVYSHPTLNLKLGLSFASGKDEMESNGTKIGELKIRSKMVYSLEYTWQNLTLRSEYSENDRTQSLYGSTALDGPSQAWYVMLSYSPTDPLSVSLLYDEYYRLKHDKYGEESTKNPIDSQPWRKDWGLGLRYDLTDNWTIKAEYHLVEGGALLMSYFNPDSLKTHWQYGAVKISFTF
ncbi:MAG: porin [Desulfobulbaceae bacterium]|nr:porin [Desulfobulbaceae bacterium]